MDTYKYYIINFKENNKKEKLITEHNTVIAMILDILNRENTVLIDVSDNKEQVLKIEDFINNERIRVKKELDKITSKDAIYKATKSYFKNLSDKNLMRDELYNKYIKRLEEVNKNLNLKDYINKIIELYVS